MIKQKKFYIIAGLVIILIAGLVYGGYRVFDQTKQIVKSLPEIKKFGENFFTPSPLLGPKQELGASNLDADTIITDTNKQRTDNNVKLLAKNDDLMNAANLKIDDMLRDQYFEHVSPATGRDASYFVGQVKYNYSYIGENLALGDFKSEEDLVNAWMNSPGHRENILRGEYSQIGAAARKGIINGRDTWLAVQIFGHPAPNCTSPDADLKLEIETKQKQYGQIDDINQQIDNLRKDGQVLIDQGNAKITEGNVDEGTDLYNKGKAKMDEANQLVEDNQYLSNLYEEIQLLVADYNNQVNKYNDCIKE